MTDRFAEGYLRCREDACKTICGRCANGQAIELYEGIECHSTGGRGLEPCAARTIRSLSPPEPVSGRVSDHHKLDDDRRVFFYEQEFYVLSNFSAFKVRLNGMDFDTSEQAYHWFKFPGGVIHTTHRAAILAAPSAHEAFKYAERHKADRNPDWDAVKVDIMRDILRAKAEQREWAKQHNSLGCSDVRVTEADTLDKVLHD